MHLDDNAHFGIGIQLPNRYSSDIPLEAEKKVVDEESQIMAVKNESADADLIQLVDVLHQNLHRPWLQRHGDLAVDPRLSAIMEGHDAIDPSSLFASIDAGEVIGGEEVKVNEAKQQAISVDEVQRMERS